LQSSSPRKVFIKRKNIIQPKSKIVEVIGKLYVGSDNRPQEKEFSNTIGVPLSVDLKNSVELET
jgi:hypothetical protein